MVYLLEGFIVVSPKKCLGWNLASFWQSMVVLVMWHWFVVFLGFFFSFGIPCCLFFWHMEPIGGCCYLNYALTSLGLPGVDISPDFVSLKVAVISSNCHLRGICSCLIIAFGSRLEQENILSVQVTGACRCCRALWMQVEKLQLMEFNCIACTGGHCDIGALPPFILLKPYNFILWCCLKPPGYLNNLPASKQNSPLSLKIFSLPPLAIYPFFSGRGKKSHANFKSFCNC